jgi:Family of unknown function (DUF5923)
MSSKCNTDANRLRDSGYQFFDKKYKGHKDNLFNSVQVWFLAWSEDPLNERFGGGTGSTSLRTSYLLRMVVSPSNLIYGPIFARSSSLSLFETLVIS